MSKLFGWDYPPGVTGNEPELCGDEEESDAEYIGRLEEEAMALANERDKWRKLAELRYKKQGQAFRRLKACQAILAAHGLKEAK